MSQEICWMSAVEVAEAVRTKRLSPVEVVDALLAQVDRVNPELNAIITRTDELARAQARAAEEQVMRGEELGPLHGVPILIKDLEETKGIRTTFGSKLYESCSVARWLSLSRVSWETSLPLLACLIRSFVSSDCTRGLFSRCFLTPAAILLFVSSAIGPLGVPFRLWSFWPIN